MYELQRPATTADPYTKLESGDFTWVTFTDHQMDKLNKILNTLPSNLIPMRDGKEYTDSEYNLGVALTQTVPNDVDSMMRALCHVFLFDRALAILKAILSGGLDDEECDA